MEAERILTVGDALKRPLFAQAHVAAGERGLHKLIRWVHILEITKNFETLLHGDEMILTTGIGLNLDASSSITFLCNLIRRKAACLCIELGHYFSTVPEELISLADQHDFPIIVFPHTVRFVDITQDLHSYIINRQHDTLQELKSLSREFHRLTLTSQGTANILKLLHKSSGRQIIFQPFPGKPLLSPALPSSEQESLMQALEARLAEAAALQPDAAPIVCEFTGKAAIFKPIGAFDQTWGCLVMTGHQPFSEFECALLDSASLSIAQELLRTRYNEERRLFRENAWVEELLSGRLEDDKQLEAWGDPELKRLNPYTFAICVIEAEAGRDTDPDERADSLGDPDWESSHMHASLLLRSLFEKHSFRPLMTVHNNRLVVIAICLKGRTPVKARLQQALEALPHMLSKDRPRSMKLLIGVSPCYSSLNDAPAGYQEAVQALSLHDCFRKPIIFYDELGVYQLLLGANDGKTLQTFIRCHLGPLIDHDIAKGSQLLLTLKVLLDHDGSKQLAAQRLFIVRQSLYYRLDKITELLGDDFMSPDRRISIQVALRAYQMLHPETFIEQSKKQAH